MTWPGLRTFPALLALAGAAAAPAQGLVILAQGTAAAAHPVGSALRPGAVLALGDRIDVLERGGTRRLDGPTVYVPLARSSAAENVRIVVAELMERRRGAAPGETRRPPATVRGMGAPMPAAARERFAGGIWTVDATRAGVTCFRPGEPPRIWRPAAAPPAEATLAAADGGAALPVRWAAAADAATWPAPLPAAPRDYLLHSADGGETRVRLVPLAAAATLDDLVVALDRAGCAAQSGYLLDHYPDAPAPAR